MTIYGLLVEKKFDTINTKVTKKEIILDDILVEVKRWIGHLNANDILEIAKRIEGFKESHIIQLGIIYKQKITRNRACSDITAGLARFLNEIPVFPENLYDNYTEFILATDDADIIINFIEKCISFPKSTDEILINGIVKMLTVYNSITIKQICKIIEKYYYYKKNKLSIFSQRIIQTRDLNNILEFADEIKNIDEEIISGAQVWEDLTDAVALLAHNNLETIFNFASKHSEANKDKLAKVLIEGRSFKWIYKFAANVENIPENVMKTIVSYVASTLSPEFIYLFLSNIYLSLENIKILTDAIIKTENTDYIGYSVISLGRIGFIQTIKNNTNLSAEEKENQIAKFGIIKRQLTTYLGQRNNLNFLNDYDKILLDELEEKLLNSDDSIENPFAPVENEKTKNYEIPNGDA